MAPVGVLMLDTRFPRPLGDIGNPATFDFPVLYRVVMHATPTRVVDDGAVGLVEAFCEAARDLEAAGVGIITTSCGFLALHQQALAASVRVPVLSSALLQVPLSLAAVGPERAVGVVTFKAEALTRAHFSGVGVASLDRVRILGTEGAPSFYRPIAEDRASMDVATAQTELVDLVAAWVTQHPEIGALVLECTNLPPYAAAMQRATGLPIWDIVTLVRWAHTSRQEERKLLTPVSSTPVYSPIGMALACPGTPCSNPLISREVHVKIRPGRPYPLGATWDGRGVNFALFSEHATAVELCLFDDAEPHDEIARIRLPERNAFVWHGYLPEARPGTLYGYRVHGPWEPLAGHRFNSNKLLSDPYARAMLGEVNWDAPVFSYPLGDGPDADLKLEENDDAWGKPLSVVVNTKFDWGDDSAPNVPWHRSVIYETHVKGFTARHPDVPERLRGTYAGLATPAAIDHFRSLGVTAVELLPIHDFIDEGTLRGRGLTNYWGYNSIGYFAPDGRYSRSNEPGAIVREFKETVKALHANGIEVILDVVYNHTAEGNHLGPTFSFRGIDNASYYRLVGDQPRYYMDYTGCGNSLNVRHPQVLKLIMDSLRYWVLEMHVDGFRFDLASALARELHEVDRLSAFFDIIHQDPILSTVKLIAEPWDVGEGGYQVGNFPVLWTEWNGKYRDTVRSFWKGDEVRAGELAFRLSGSSDLYETDGRRPYASINFVIAHDGFTLADLVSYNDKHNDANGEENRDGESHNNSWNCGVEGPTDDPEVQALRERQQRNFLATLAFSQGVPMLAHGDEIGRTQQGNNNAYCQDNEISWLDWSLDERRTALLDFARRIVKIRHEQPVLRRREFFRGRTIRGSDVKDLTWLEASGAEMTDEDWDASTQRPIGLLMAGDQMTELDEDGDRIVGDSLLLLLNARHEQAAFTLPDVGDEQHRWELLVDTARPEVPEGDLICAEGDAYQLESRSLALLRLGEVPTHATRPAARPPADRPSRQRRRRAGA